MSDTQNSALEERIKELECLYGIAALLTEHSLPLEELLERVAAIIPAAWQFPERTGCVVQYGRIVRRTERFCTNGALLETPVIVNAVTVGSITVSVAPYDSHEKFLAEERRLLATIAALLGTVIDRKEVDLSLQRNAEMLKRRSEELKRKNIALHEVLSHIGEERQNVSEHAARRVRERILPLVNRLPDASTDLLPRYVTLLREALREPSLGAASVPSDLVGHLSPREVEVAGLIRAGMTTKQIAGALHVSLQTVEKHRHNIRRKLGIAGEKINLEMYLRDVASR